MPSRSRIVQYTALTVTAVAVFLIAAWVALNAIEPVPAPPVPPSKGQVSFDPRVDVRNHPLFSTLQTLTRGKVLAGALGKQNPFLNGDGGIAALEESARTLGTIQEVSLNGGALIAVSRGSEKGVTALVRGSQGNYEVHRFYGDGTSEEVGNWTAPSDPSIAPIALQEDRSKKVWLLSAGGRVGSLQSDGKPLWGSVALEGIQPALTPNQVSFALDGAGRMWFTDGAFVFVGNGIGFQRIDLAAQLSAENRQALGVGEDGVLSLEARTPRRLQMLADGRIAVLTDRFMTTFPLNLQGLAQVTVAEGTIVAVEPDGTLWSVTRNADGTVTKWTRASAEGTREFTDAVVLPKQAGSSPRLAAVDGGTLYALDYAPDAAVLWSTREGIWAASVLSPQGPQPQDRVEWVVADRDGSVWAVLAQRGLLRIQPSQP